MKTLSLLISFVLLLASSLFCRADVLDSGAISGSSLDLGSYVAATSNFTLTAGQLSNIELLAEFDIIDDGLEIIVNGTSMFVSMDTSQYGNQDFVVTAVQPNDVANPWSANSNGLARLIVLANGSGTSFSGSVDTTTATIVDYVPNSTVQDFNNLLVVGANQIEFVNHNASQGASLQGNFSVCEVLPVAVPEPGSLGLIGIGMLFFAGRRRRKAQH